MRPAAASPLLAVLVGMPELSRLLQQALRSPDAPNLAVTPLIEVMNRAIHPSTSPTPADRRAAEEWATVER